MIDIEYNFPGSQIRELGNWLEENMPNPALPDPQRWTIGCDVTGTRFGIHFENNHDALLFSLRWSGVK
jgi:hypothetical protein